MDDIVMFRNVEGSQVFCDPKVIKKPTRREIIEHALVLQAFMKIWRDVKPTICPTCGGYEPLPIPLVTQDPEYKLWISNPDVQDALMSDEFWEATRIANAD